MLVISNSGN